MGTEEPEGKCRSLGWEQRSRPQWGRGAESWKEGFLGGTGLPLLDPASLRQPPAAPSSTRGSPQMGPTGVSASVAESGVEQEGNWSWRSKQETQAHQQHLTQAGKNNGTFGDTESGPLASRGHAYR